jgi:tetratricopeptide (TPR) repeat protein
MGLGRYKEAIPSLEEALKIKPDYELAIVSLAECYTYLQEPDHALNYLHQSIAAKGDAQVDFLPVDQGMVEYLRHFLLGRNYEALERYDEAFTEYRTAVQLNHQRRIDAPVAMFTLARKLNRGREGIEAMEHCITIDPENADHRYNLGVLFLEEERYDEAKRCFQDAILRDSGNAKAYLNLGYILRKEGSLRDAEEMYQKAIEADPEFPDSYANLGYLYLDMERYNEAIKMLSLVHEREGNLLDIALGLCTAYAAMGMVEDLKEMIEEIGRMIGISVKNAPVEDLLAIGEILLQRQILSCAQFTMMTVLHLHPDHPLAAYELAKVYTLEKNYWKAIPMYEKLIVNNPNDPRLFEGLGECYKALNVPEAAALCEQQVKKISKVFNTSCR